MKLGIKLAEPQTGLAMRRRQVLKGCSAVLGAFAMTKPTYAGNVASLEATRKHFGQAGTVSSDRRRSRERLKAALTYGFGIQYWGQDYNTFELSNAPHGLLVLEASRVGASDDADEVLFDPEEIGELTRHGARTIVGYLNLTEIETNRDYWRDACIGAAAPEVPQTEPWVGPKTAAGEQLSVFWDPSWERILTDRIEKIISLGFDGIFLDDVLHYFTYLAGLDLAWAKRDRASAPQGYATAMMKLVLRLTRFTRSLRSDAVVIVNNGVYLAEDAGDEIGVDRAEALFTSYASEIDGILVESAFGPSAADAVRSTLFRRYLLRGVSVLTVDFAKQFPNRSIPLTRWIIDYRASREGFVSYFAEDEKFDQLYPPSGQETIRSSWQRTRP